MPFRWRTARDSNGATHVLSLDVCVYLVTKWICLSVSWIQRTLEAVHKCWGHNWVTCCVWGTVELADVVYRLARQDMLKRQMRNLGRMHKWRCRFSTLRIKLTTVYSCTTVNVLCLPFCRFNIFVFISFAMVLCATINYSNI